MPWTVLTCDNVEFASAQHDYARILPNEAWETAKVSIISMSEHDRWLMITTARSAVPVVWRAIREGWSVASDELSMTMLLQYPSPTEAERAAKTVLKLRFSSRSEFWTFAAHLTFARIRMQANGWEGTSYAGSEQSALSNALGNAGL